MKKINLIIAFIMTIFISLLLSSCGSDSTAMEPEEVIRPVRYIEVTKGETNNIKSFSGIAQAGSSSKLSFKVNGTIEKIHVKVGDVVKRGQVIAHVDPYDYKLMAQEAEASLARGKAEFRNASANYKRVRALYENNNASKNDLDLSRAAADSSRAAVIAIEKKMELVKRQLSYTTIRAPYNCSVAAVPGEPKENVAAGQPVVMVTNLSHIEVDVAIPGVYISEISEGSSATVVFDTYQNRKLEAQISEVGVSPRGMATTFPVTVTLTDKSDFIKPGMSAVVTFKLKSPDNPDYILIPPVAVGEDRLGVFVYTVEKAGPELGIVHRRSVEVSELTPGGIEITEGLEGGDIVVTAGLSRIGEGKKVKLLADRGEIL